MQAHDGVSPLGRVHALQQRGREIGQAHLHTGARRVLQRCCTASNPVELASHQLVMQLLWDDVWWGSLLNGGGYML